MSRESGAIHIDQLQCEKQAVIACDELVAVVSHDLRNPMAVISMLCGVIKNTFIAGGVHAARRIGKAIDTLQHAAERMTSLLNDLLDSSKIQAGRYAVAPEILQVSRILEQVNALLVPLALEKIDFRLESEPSLKVWADAERLFQVLSNLVGNAVKSTPSQGRICVSVFAIKNEIFFSVSDTGKGITAE